MSGKPESLFDKRIVQRNVRKNRVSRKEVDQFLKSLPDVAAKAVPVFSPGQPGAAIGNDDDDDDDDDEPDRA